MIARVVDTYTPGRIEVYDFLARSEIISPQEHKTKTQQVLYAARQNNAVFEAREIGYLTQREEPSEMGIAAATFTYVAKREKGSIEEILSRAGVEQLETRAADDNNLESADPLVLKRTTVQRGVDKYLIETDEQREKAAKFLATLTQSERDHWRLQDYFESAEGNCATSIRVVTSPVGSILGASAITRSLRGESSGGLLRAVGADWSPLADPESAFFLSSRDIRSNADAGGTVLPLAVNGRLPSAKRLSRQDKKLLTKVGIDSELPDDIAAHAITTSMRAGPEIAILLGLDYIPTTKGAFSLLEVNRHPGLETFRKWQGLSTALTDNDAQDRMLELCADSIRDYYS